MPKNPEDLQEYEIITDDFVRGTRLKALEHGFNSGYDAGWRDGASSVARAIGQKGNRWQYGIENYYDADRGVIENQTVFPTTLKEKGFGASEWTKEQSRKNLNSVIDLVPSKFLTGGRKYTPEGKQFSKKKFIETLLNDFRSMIDVGYQAGFKKAQEKQYRNEEMASGIFEGPAENNIFYAWQKYITPSFLEELQKTDAETFAYQEARDKMIDEVDWENIYKREVLESDQGNSSYFQRVYPNSEKYKQKVLRSWGLKNELDLERLREKLKNREQSA